MLELSLSSSWGNGHATTYRALLAVMAVPGHDILFLEYDKPWSAAHRDLAEPAYGAIQLEKIAAEIRPVDARRVVVA